MSSSHYGLRDGTTTYPAFFAQPLSETISPGSTVVFNISSNTIPAPSYQWLLNGSEIIGAARSMLVIQNASAASDGNYSCVATNSSGEVVSNPATLTAISTSDFGRLANLSCRSQVGTGANILIAGFAVGGADTAGSEPVLIRASGPALSGFGVTGTLPDPKLQLYSESVLIGTNNSWAGDATIVGTSAQVGAFPWTNPASHDSALLETLDTGPYTAQIVGQSGDTGVSLVEVYDATYAGSYTPTSPRLVNLSARAQVGTGANVLIAGFVIEGATSETVLIRASGPALAASPFNISGTLPDPELLLEMSNSDGTSTRLAANVGWGGNIEISDKAASIGAFSWGASATSDSAILITLPPGAYTAQVSGATGDSGIALVELYEVK